MKIILFIIFPLLSSCAYPDIDSVPTFKEIELTEEELFDLCQLSSTDKSEIDSCIKKKINNK